MKSRFIEDFLAIVGILMAVFYGAMEALARGGFVTHNEHAGFPWITAIVFLGCVLPKTVGRMTAGKVWEAIGSRVRGGGGGAP